MGSVCWCSRHTHTHTRPLLAHPSVIYSALSIKGRWDWPSDPVRGDPSNPARGSYVPCERQGTPWTGHPPITEPTYREKEPFTFTIHSFQLTLTPICMCSDYGRKLEYPERGYTNMQNPHRKALIGSEQDTNPEPDWCEVTALTTTLRSPPVFPQLHSLCFYVYNCNMMKGLGIVVLA